MEPSPYVIYADFEAFNIECDHDTKGGKVADQVANSFAYVVVRSDGVMIKEILYRGEPGDNIPRLFVESLVKTKDLITCRPAGKIRFDAHKAIA